MLMKNIKMILIFGLMIGVILIVIGWSYYRVTTAYNSDVHAAIPELALYIASATAVIAGLGLILTNKSLILTRETTRPFLNVDMNIPGGASIDRRIVNLVITNTGNLPADHVVVDCHWYSLINDIVEDWPVQLEKPCQSIIFPSDKAEPTYIIEEQSEVAKLYNIENGAKITISYRNKLTGSRHTTRRTFRIVIASISSAINMPQPISVPSEDFWD